MISNVYCPRCRRAFSVSVFHEMGTPNDHKKELLDPTRNSDLRRLGYGREVIRCGYAKNGCDGTLPDFDWWTRIRAQAKRQGKDWPEQPLKNQVYNLEITG
jgi:hypothetical protein